MEPLWYWDWTFVTNVLNGETVQQWLSGLHVLLAKIGVPEPYPDAEQILLIISVFVGTVLLVIMLLKPKTRHALMQETKAAEKQAYAAHQKLLELQEKLAALEAEKGSPEGKEVRVWMDGAFDMMHFGHMNAFRQGRALGTFLVVGVNSDESITTCKGTPPVMNDEERLTAVEACKWVDVVVPNCPYIMSPEYLNKMIEEHKIDYVVHGDDPCIVDGKDVYQDAKDRGLYRSIPRTEGVSTTEIVGRMLTLNRDHHDKIRSKSADAQLISKQRVQLKSQASNFLTSTNFLRIFSRGTVDPAPGNKIVYIDGAWDMFHAGHAGVLKQAKALGDYLIVGIHNDATVNQFHGSNYPIMNLNERVLSVLGCRYVDDVLIDAPWKPTRDMLKSMNITYVACGKTRDANVEFQPDKVYEVPKERGILEVLPSPSQLTVDVLVDRIVAQRDVFQKKVDKKMKAEEAYYEDRYASDHEDEK